jgi:hypothetical protein
LTGISVRPVQAVRGRGRQEMGDGVSRRRMAAGPPVSRPDAMDALGGHRDGISHHMTLAMDSPCFVDVSAPTLPSVSLHFSRNATSTCSGHTPGSNPSRPSGLSPQPPRRGLTNPEQHLPRGPLQGHLAQRNPPRGWLAFLRCRARDDLRRRPSQWLKTAANPASYVTPH